MQYGYLWSTLDQPYRAMTFSLGRTTHQLSIISIIRAAQGFKASGQCMYRGYQMGWQIFCLTTDLCRGGEDSTQRWFR